MSSLAEFFIKRDTLETMLKVVNAKNQSGISLQIGINDETSKYGSNVSVSVSQTKEEREAKKDKYYIGSGKVFWTDGKISVAEKVERPFSDKLNPLSDMDEMPF